MGAGPAQGSGCGARRGLFSFEGSEKPPRALERARPGAQSGGGAGQGGGGGATAAPPEAKFEKRTRFPPFFKPKNKTFSLVSSLPLCPRPCPLRPPRGSPGRPGPTVVATALPFPLRRGGGARGPCPRRMAPPCGRAAAPHASRGAPQAAAAPCWRVPVSLRLVSRPTSLALPALPRRWLAAASSRAEPSVCFPPPRRGLARTGGSRAPWPPPTHPVAGALPTPSPFLKGQRQAATPAPRRACGVSGGPQLGARDFGRASARLVGRTACGLPRA